MLSTRTSGMRTPTRSARWNDDLPAEYAALRARSRLELRRPRADFAHVARKMSTNITGPRVLRGFEPETLQTPEGRAGHLQALCAVARRLFEVRGSVDLLSWIWVQQNPEGAPTPAILAVELVGAAHSDAFDARVIKACDLGNALAVATVTQHHSVEVLFESYAGTEIHGAPIRASSDPLNPSATRRLLDPFSLVTVDHAPDRFTRFLHAPRTSGSPGPTRRSL
jgi:hypothetical protein